MTPDPLNQLVARLARLPGIGEKTAQRLAFYILRAPPEFARELAGAIEEVVDKVHLCSRCFALTESDLCSFCTDPRRDERTLCVVEGVPDLIAVERTREFKGRYHVLHGVLSPLGGIGPDQLKIKDLIARLHDGHVEEVIVATNPDVEGEATALSHPPAQTPGDQGQPDRPGFTDGRRSRVRRPGDAGQGPLRATRAVEKSPATIWGGASAVKSADVRVDAIQGRLLADYRRVC